MHAVHPIPVMIIHSLMLRRTPLAPERTDCRNVRLESLLLSTVRPGRQFDERMQRHLHPRALLLRHIHIVSVDTS